MKIPMNAQILYSGAFKDASSLDEQIRSVEAEVRSRQKSAGFSGKTVYREISNEQDYPLYGWWWVET